MGPAPNLSEASGSQIPLRVMDVNLFVSTIEISRNHHWLLGLKVLQSKQKRHDLAKVELQDAYVSSTGKSTSTH